MLETVISAPVTIAGALAMVAVKRKPASAVVMTQTPACYIMTILQAVVFDGALMKGGPAEATRNCRQSIMDSTFCIISSGLMLQRQA